MTHGPATARPERSLRASRHYSDSLHRRFVDRAKQERRTIAQQATVLLAEALSTVPPRERRRGAG